MLCGTSSTCPLTECPRWKNSHDDDINLYRLDKLPCRRDDLNNSCPQYSNQNHDSDDCSDNNGNKDCHKAYENINTVISFLNDQIIPRCEGNDQTVQQCSVDFCGAESYVVLDSAINDDDFSFIHYGKRYLLKNQAVCFYDKKKVLFGYYEGEAVDLLPQSRHSTADQLEIVAHEFGHILIDQIFPNGFANNSDSESKALEESFCDFLAILASRYVQGTWNWIIGPNIDNGIRDFLNPSIAHMDQYKSTAIPNETNDWGYVHTNCGIHSKACAEIIRSIDDFDFLCKLFCLTLLKLEVKKSSEGVPLSFEQSREAMQKAVEEMSDLSEEERDRKLLTIVEAFDSVGIEESEDPANSKVTIKS